jgi:hypothetical protein
MTLFRTILLSFLLSAPLFAHEVDLPEWVRNSTSCTIDLFAAPGSVEGEVDLTRKDALAVLGRQTWDPSSCGVAVAQLIQAGLTLDGKAPTLVRPMDPSPRNERWHAQWPGPMAGAFDVRVDLFRRLGSPGWCCIFVVPDIGGVPEQSFFFKSDETFHWPKIPVLPGVTWTRFLALGYRHILPEGLDHILFVLGLCLAAISLRSLLVQITAFSVAHTLTLGLAAKGIVNVPPGIVEPLIAASIVLVAVENLARKEPSRWRWGVAFLFGLVHGMGFAGVLRDTGLPQEAFLPSLLAFNLGVEAGQLTVVTAALVVLWHWRKKKIYRKNILVPGSFVIALAGVFWTLQRIFF